MDCSQPGSSVHGIFQARILEWVALSFSKAYRYFLSFHLICFCKTQGRSIKNNNPGTTAPPPGSDPSPLLLENILPALLQSIRLCKDIDTDTDTHTHTHTHTPSKMPGSQMHSETHIHQDTQGHADTGTLGARREVDQNTLWCGRI